MLVVVVVFTCSVSCFPRGLGTPWRWNSVSSLPVPRRVLGTQCVCGCWLLAAMYFRNVLSLCLFSICLYLLAPSSWKWIMILHLNQEEVKTPILPLLFLFLFFLNSHCRSLLGLFVYLFVSPSELCTLVREEWCLIRLYIFKGSVRWAWHNSKKYALDICQINEYWKAQIYGRQGRQWEPSFYWKDIVY